MSDIGVIESNPNVPVFVQVDINYIDKKDPYAATRSEKQVLATFLKNEAADIKDRDFLLVENEKYQLNAISTEDEISSNLHSDIDHG